MTGACERITGYLGQPAPRAVAATAALADLRTLISGLRDELPPVIS
jgi:hypothetical protein